MRNICWPADCGQLARMDWARPSLARSLQGQCSTTKHVFKGKSSGQFAQRQRSMLEEAIYLFLDNEFSAREESVCCFGVVDPSSKFLQDIENHFARFEFDTGESDENGSELKPLSRRQLVQNIKKTKTVLLTNEKTLLQLEFALRESGELVDKFREVFCHEGLLFLVENWDASYFWTGASIRRWFNARFPREPKKVRYAKPPSILDLLYEFLESIPQSPDRLLTLKKVLLLLSAEDRSF